MSISARLAAMFAAFGLAGSRLWNGGSVGEPAASRAAADQPRSSASSSRHDDRAAADRATRAALRRTRRRGRGAIGRNDRLGVRRAWRPRAGGPAPRAPRERRAGDRARQRGSRSRQREPRRHVARARSPSPGALPPADSEQAEFQLRQTEIAQRKARRDLDLTRIIAPFAGIVTFAPRGHAGSLQRATRCFASPSSRPSLLASSRAGGERAAPARRRAALGRFARRRRVPARIVHAAPFVDAASGTREIVLASWARQRDRGGSSVPCGLDARRGVVVIVPRAAIASEGYVVVVENGRSTLRPVTVGRDVGGGRVEVSSGLSPGERLARPTR